MCIFRYDVWVFLNFWMECTYLNNVWIMNEWVISHSFTLLHHPYERDMTQLSMWMIEWNVRVWIMCGCYIRIWRTFTYVIYVCEGWDTYVKDVTSMWRYSMCASMWGYAKDRYIFRYIYVGVCEGCSGNGAINMSSCGWLLCVYMYICIYVYMYIFIMYA